MDGPVKFQEFTYKPDSHVGSDLVVPASTGVQLTANVLANNFAEPSLVGSVNVLIVRLDDKLPYEDKQ